MSQVSNVSGSLFDTTHFSIDIVAGKGNVPLPNNVLQNNVACCLQNVVFNEFVPQNPSTSVGWYVYKSIRKATGLPSDDIRSNFLSIANLTEENKGRVMHLISLNVYVLEENNCVSLDLVSFHPSFVKSKTYYETPLAFLRYFMDAYFGELWELKFSDPNFDVTDKSTWPDLTHYVHTTVDEPMTYYVDFTFAAFRIELLDVRNTNYRFTLRSISTETSNTSTVLTSSVTANLDPQTFDDKQLSYQENRECKFVNKACFILSSGCAHRNQVSSTEDGLVCFSAITNLVFYLYELLRSQETSKYSKLTFTVIVTIEGLLNRSREILLDLSYWNELYDQRKSAIFWHDCETSDIVEKFSGDTKYIRIYSPNIGRTYHYDSVIGPGYVGLLYHGENGVSREGGYENRFYNLLSVPNLILELLVYKFDPVYGFTNTTPVNGNLSGQLILTYDYNPVINSHYE